MATVTQARAKEYFNYDPATGQLIYKLRPESEFTPANYSQHKRRVGTAITSANGDGYLVVCIDNKYYSGHKVIWLIMTGEWVQYPEFEIDHINGVRSDNRWANLRKVTKSQNQRNGSQRVNNSSGVHGVNWKPRSDGDGGGWVARIWNGPKHVYLGQYSTLYEAAIARKAAERVLGFTGTDRAPSIHAIKKIQAELQKGQE